MAKKGGSSHLKRVASPRYMPVIRKGEKWLTKPSPGPHGFDRSLALGTVVGEVLQLADSMREVKRILKSGDVLIDGRAGRDVKFPVGLMDVFSIPKINKSYWIGVDKKGRFRPIEVDSGRAGFKLCRVEGKRSIRKGVTQLSLHDGRTVVCEKEFGIGDTVKISIPEQKIVSVMKLELNARCLITSGRHAGEVAVVDELYHKKGARRAEAKLHSDAESFITVRDYLFVVGEEAQVFG